MAIRLPDGSLQMADGRILYANSVILAQDLLELMPLFTPPPAWPFISGGGGGSGPQGPAGPAGSGGGGGGTQGSQGFQGTNPGPTGPQGNQGIAGAGAQGPQGSQGTAGTNGVQGPQGNTGTDGADGAQGFQGLAGAGVQGPQGNQGIAGLQGVQGFQGLEGPQGFQGLEGPQGFQGLEGPQGFQGFQGALNPDIFAATRVVSLTGDGTDATIAAAITALPAEGGKIYVKQGTYVLGATLTMPLKPVEIIGSGDATVLSLGAVAIPAFTVPSGYTSNTPIVIRNLMVTGTEVANQTVLEYADANGLAEIFLEHVKTSGVEKTINVTNGSISSSTPGQDDVRIHMTRCRIRPCSTDNSVILSNPSVGYPRCWMTEVEFIGDSLFAIPLGRTAPLFGRLASDDYFGDCYLDGCEMSLGTGESDFAAFESVNSILWNNDDVNTTVDWFIFGSFIGLSNGTIVGSSFRGIHIEVEESGINFLSNWLVDCPLELYGQGIVIGDNHIEQDGVWPVAFPYVIQVNNENMVIRNNVFDIGAPSTFVVDLEAPCTVTGNDFSPVNNGTNGSIYIASSEAIVSNNRFEFAPTGGPPIRVALGGGGSFTDNWDLWWEASGPIQAPVIPAGNVMQGVAGFYGTGTVGGVATNTIIVNYRNTNGLSQVKGYVINAGANPITVRERYFTVDQGIFTRSTVIGAGVKRVLDPYDFAGLAPGTPDNQVIKYAVDVSGTTISWTIYFPAPGNLYT